MTERLRFDNLDQHLLLKNGNYLYKVPFRGGWAVLKVYYGSRSGLSHAIKTLENLLANQTSYMPRARLRTELECLALWRQIGVRVFDTYDDVVVEGLPEGGYALYEYVPGLRFVDYFGDAAVPLEERLAVWRRFLAIWHHRHDEAVRRREPRLIHENGDLKHVMIWKDELLFFDFEMVFRSRRRVPEFVGREISAYLKSLGKTVGPELFERFLEETVRHYPSREYLEQAYTFAFRNPNRVVRAFRWLDRTIKARAGKPFSKYNVARRLRKALDRT